MPETKTADVIVQGLRSHQDAKFFTVSGNQILPLIDAAGRAGIPLVHMRHETAAVYAAIAAAEVTGYTSIALVSAGPGFLAALQGLGVAHSMELPVVLVSGAAPLSQRGMGAFQDLDQRTIASSVCKGSFEPASADEAVQTVMNARYHALAGIPGPTHLSLPADILATPCAPAEVNQPDDAAQDVSEDTQHRLDEMARALNDARRPLVIARPAATRSHAGLFLRELTAALGIEPVITESPRGLSDLRYAEIFARMKEADCLLVIGPADFSSAFLAEATIGTPPDILLIDAPGDPAPRRADHVHVRADLNQALRYLNAKVHRRQPIADDWAVLWPISAPTPAPAPTDAGMHPLAVSEALRAILQPEDILILDGGEFCQWVRYGLRDLPNRLLWNGKLGAIGGSIPMAIGATATTPTGRVFAVLGDGSAGYHLSEFETAAREVLRFTAIIGNDALWAAEWHMQVERYGPDRTFATALTSARYDLAAQGFGATGYLANDPASLRDALAAALDSPTATCINALVAPVRSPAVVMH